MLSSTPVVQPRNCHLRILLALPPCDSCVGMMASRKLKSYKGLKMLQIVENRPTATALSCSYIQLLNFSRPLPAEQTTTAQDTLRLRDWAKTRGGCLEVVLAHHEDSGVPLGCCSCTIDARRPDLRRRGMSRLVCIPTCFWCHGESSCWRRSARFCLVIFCQRWFGVRSMP